LRNEPTAQESVVMYPELDARVPDAASWASMNRCNEANFMRQLACRGRLRLRGTLHANNGNADDQVYRLIWSGERLHRVA